MSEPMSLALARAPRWRWMAVVIVVHGLMAWWLSASWQRPSLHPQPRSQVRLVTVTLPPLVAHSASPRPRSGGSGQPASTHAVAPVRQAPAAPRPPRSGNTRETAPEAAPAAGQVPGSEPPSAAASAATPVLAAASAASAPLAAASGPSGETLMHGAATRLAIQQATRGKALLSERADQASQAPDRLDASARLGKEIKDAGHGDCLKGEYAGGGMGLLSAPFLLLAKARGQCAK